MSVQQLHPEHPVIGCVTALHAALDAVAEVDPVFMRTQDQAAALVELERAQARLAELKLRVLRAADGVALESGARSAADWLAAAARRDVGGVLAEARLADVLATHQRLASAVASGSVHLAQARVVADALAELPADLDPETRVRCEEWLVEQAGVFEPKRLRRLARRVLEVVAPEVAEEHERRLLEAEEARARRLTTLTMRRRFDGTTEISARVADAVAARLATYLDAYAAPRRQQDAAGDRRLTRAQEWGHAFGDLLEAVPSDKLPRHGGASTQVVVTLDLQTLLDGLGVAGLGTGEAITAGEALRLACTAGIVPMVLGGEGQPLHLGRTRRLFTPAQRTALAARDQHCRAAGCTRPATWCEAHHLRPWAAGGTTDLGNGVLLCSWHHHRAHDPTYSTRIGADGDLTFHRRP